MALTKPTVDSATWGNTNTSSPDMVTPGAGLVNTGFLGYPTKLKRGHLNWLINKLHQGLRYYMAQGIPAWDASETQYVVGSVVSYLGVPYILNAGSPAGTNPTVDTAHWGPFITMPGTLMRRSFLTSGTTLASTARTTRARIMILGGGGGSGGHGGGLSSKNIMGGGAAGSWGMFETTIIPGTWNYVIGAGGTAGASPASTATSAGGDGGASTLSDGTNTFTAPGGKAGNAIYPGDPGAAASVSPGTSTSGLGFTGAPGSMGFTNDTGGSGVGSDGGGGSSNYGGGGRGGYTVGGGDRPGNPGSGRGAGASGAGVNIGGSNTPQAGAAGSGGLIILDEYS